MKGNSTKILLLATGMVLTLSACGGGGSSGDSGSDSDLIDLPGLAVRGLGDQPASEVFNPWLVSIDTFRLESRTPGTGDADIATLQYSASRTVQQHIDFYSETTADMDTCEISGDTDSSSSNTGSTATSTIPYASGGQEVVINTPAGTWYSIPERELGRYDVNNELPAAIPSDATLSIPGDVFPTVGAFPIIEPPVPVRISPITESLSLLDTYQWEPVGGPGIYIRMSMLEYDADGDFVDFRVRCNVIDDGEFELPIEALDVIASGGDSTFRIRYVRDHRRLDLHEGVVIYSQISVAE